MNEHRVMCIVHTNSTERAACVWCEGEVSISEARLSHQTMAVGPRKAGRPITRRPPELCVVVKAMDDNGQKGIWNILPTKSGPALRMILGLQHCIAVVPIDLDMMVWIEVLETTKRTFKSSGSSDF